MIRAFSRDETIRRATRGDSDDPDSVLEADVLELAIVAGITAIGATRPPVFNELATQRDTILKALLEPEEYEAFTEQKHAIMHTHTTGDE